MTRSVVFTPEAEVQLTDLYSYIAENASPQTALRYTEAIVACCEALRLFPLRGTRRDDIRPGLRTTHDKKRCVIAFTVDEDRVSIIGIFYGGQDHESSLGDELGE